MSETREPAHRFPRTEAFSDDQARALLAEIMRTVRDAAIALPKCKAHARTLVGAEKTYAEGLADGVEITLAQITDKCRPFVEANGG